MLGLLASLIGLVPGLTGLAASWHATDLENKTKLLMAQTGADRDTAIALLNANAQVQTKWWFVALIPVLWAIPFVAYVWKAVLWDNVVAIFLGIDASTPALNGNLGVIFMMIVTFYFVHGMTKP